MEALSIYVPKKGELADRTPFVAGANEIKRLTITGSIWRINWIKSYGVASKRGSD
jgi:hypothetical protein